MSSPAVSNSPTGSSDAAADANGKKFAVSRFQIPKDKDKEHVAINISLTFS
jgi:hypothetical protein